MAIVPFGDLHAVFEPSSNFENADAGPRTFWLANVRLRSWGEILSASCCFLLFLRLDKLLRTCTIITGEPNELVAEKAHSDACHSATGNPRAVAIRRGWEGGLTTVPGRRDDNKTCLDSDKQARK
jgi:hypothetical protein